MIGPRRSLRWLVALATLWLAPGTARSNGLEAGIFEADITPQIGVPLAGYGARHRFPDLLGLDKWAHYLKPSTWVFDPIHARVLVLRSGATQLAFVSLDLIGISSGLRADVLQEIAALSIDPNAVFVSATHTHSGPGAMTDNDLFEPTVTDRYEPGIYQNFVRDVAETVKKAHDALEPSVLRAAAVDVPGVQKNREGSANLNPQANLLLVRGTGADAKWLGAVVNFAIHGTTLGPQNLGYSGDIPGAMALRIGKALGAANGGAPVPVLFINGAEGDVSPLHHGPGAMNTLADTFAQKIVAELGAGFDDPNRVRDVAGDWKVHSTEVDLKGPFLYVGHDLLPNAPALKWVGLGLGHWLPETTRIWSLELGDMRLMTWPGEPTTALGEKLQALGERVGAAQTWVLGLTNDHLAYFTTPTEWENGGYAADNSLYGPYAGIKIVNEHCKLLGLP